MKRQKNLYTFAVLKMKPKIYKAHGAAIYFYLKKRLFSFIVYSALTVLTGSAVYLFFLITAVFLYLIALKRSHYIILRDDTLIINKGFFVKRLITLNKYEICNIKAKRGVLGRIFGFTKIKLFCAYNAIPLCEIVLNKKDSKALIDQII